MATGPGSVGVLPPEFFGISGLAKNLRQLSAGLDEKKQRKREEDREDREEERAEEQRALGNRLAISQDTRQGAEALRQQNIFDIQTKKTLDTNDAFIALGYGGGASEFEALQAKGQLDMADLQERLVQAQTTSAAFQPGLIAEQIATLRAERGFKDRQLSIQRAQGIADSPMTSARIEEAIELARRTGISLDMALAGISNPGAIPQLDAIITGGRKLIADDVASEVENANASLDIERFRALISLVSIEGLVTNEAAKTSAEVALQEMLEESIPGLARFETTQTGGFLGFFQKDTPKLTLRPDLLVTASGQAAQQILDEVSGTIDPLDEGVAERAQQRLTTALENNTPEVLHDSLHELLEDTTRSDAERQIAETMLMLLELDPIIDPDEDATREQIISENGDDAFAALSDEELQTQFTALVEERNRLQSSAQTGVGSGSPLSASIGNQQDAIKIAAKARAIQRELARRGRSR